MSGYRITLFADGPRGTVTDDVLEELQHALRLYEDDRPAMHLSISAVAPLVEKEAS